VQLSEIALLYRSNAQSRVLEHALFNAGMSYRVYGGLRFFERQEIKHALAYLRLLASDEDDGALLRIINFPTRGIGNRSIEQLQDLARLRGVSLWRAAREKALEKSGREDGAPTKGVDAFVALIAGMRAACEGLPLPEIIEHVIEHSGLKLYYQNERDGADRLENLDELVNAAAGFINDEAQEDRSLTSFLAHAALEAGDNQAQAGTDALQLMTVHSAKGLEFHSVFISGLEEGLFPHENSLSEADGREEERRLMYVALTRARRRLYLSFAQSRMLHGQTRYNIASSFFHEIPEALLKRINRGGAFAVHEPQPRGGYSTGRIERIAPRVVTDPDLPWRIGQNVMHPKFGVGVIVGAEGRGSDARVQVNFDRNGTKWLALEYAKLAPA
jgi:DNA helicase-2/ATP-dependent DNA helicase PcrA